MTIALIICGTVIVVTGLVLYSAIRMAKIEREKEEAWWREYGQKIFSEENKTVNCGGSEEMSATTESVSKTATDAQE